jgi:uncharacterized protein (TIGR02722 family)
MRTLPSLLAAAVLVAPLLLAGCGGPDTTVNRTDPNAVRDLSGNWNATDSQQTAQFFTQSVTSDAWCKNFHDKFNRNPVIKVGRVTNKSDEDIETKIFTDDIRRALLKSGLVDVVASNDEADQSRDERRDQDVNASAETRKESFQESGADFLLYGSIDVQHDSSGMQKQKFYDVDLNLTNVKTQALTWEDSHKIAKDVSQKGYN